MLRCVASGGVVPTSAATAASSVTAAAIAVAVAGGGAPAVIPPVCRRKQHRRKRRQQRQWQRQRWVHRARRSGHDSRPKVLNCAVCLPGLARISGGGGGSGDDSTAGGGARRRRAAVAPACLSRRATHVRRVEEDVGDRAVYDAATASPPPTEVLRRCIRCEHASQECCDIALTVNTPWSTTEPSLGMTAATAVARR